MMIMRVNVAVHGCATGACFGGVIAGLAFDTPALAVIYGIAALAMLIDGGLGLFSREAP